MLCSFFFFFFNEARKVYGKDLGEGMLGWTFLVWLVGVAQSEGVFKSHSCNYWHLLWFFFFFLNYEQKIWHCKELAHGLLSLTRIMHGLGLWRISKGVKPFYCASWFKTWLNLGRERGLHRVLRIILQTRETSGYLFLSSIMLYKMLWLYLKMKL